MAKSIYLSEGRFAGVDEPPEWKVRLHELQVELKSGRELEYDRNDLARIRETKSMMEEVPMKTVWGTVGRFFLPGVLFVVVLWILIWILRSIRD